MTLEQAQSKYGAIINGVWADAGKWIVKYTLPDSIAAVLINSATKQPTTHIYMNRDMLGPFDHALGLIILRGLVSQLKTFDGCFEIRPVRGHPDSCSCHSYALAVDINALDNALGSDGSISPELVKCFTDAGFVWGGNFSTRKDPMHFSIGWESRAA